jgi:hypothetical protein
MPSFCSKEAKKLSGKGRAFSFVLIPSLPIEVRADASYTLLKLCPCNPALCCLYLSAVTVVGCSVTLPTLFIIVHVVPKNVYWFSSGTRVSTAFNHWPDKKLSLCFVKLLYYRKYQGHERTPG